MGKDGMLKGIIGLQAVCMIVLAVFVVLQQVPGKSRGDDGGSLTGSGTAEGDPAATVGTQTISQAELIAQLKKLYGDSVLRTLMLRSALDQESAKGGLSVSDNEVRAELASQMAGYEDEDSFYREMKNQLGMSRDEVYADTMYRLLLEKWMTRDIVVPDDRVDTYMKEHAVELAPVTRVHLRWIVVSSRKKASSIIEELRQGSDFAALAEQNSLDEGTASGGGDLGLIDEDDPFLKPAAAKAAQQLEPGDISGPIKMDGKYAVVQLLERQMPPVPDEQELREGVRKAIALDEAGSLRDGENRLLLQYDASAAPGPVSTPARG